VLNSEEEGFENKLKELSKKLNANVALECVAGPIVGKIVDALMYKGKVISYG
jgi:NADPH:quinone reductase-like Zn-dependent oxidoreductase